MKLCDGCQSWIPDDAGACPSCGRAAAPAPAVPASSPPPEPPSADPRPDPQTDARVAAIRARAAGRVRALGLMFLFFGGMLLVMVAVSAYSHAAGDATNEIPEWMAPLLTPDFREALDEARPLAEDPWVKLAGHFIPFALAAFLVWSGMALRHLQRRRAALGAALALLALAPCQSCCCLAGIPLGLYALYVLTAGETRVVTSA